MKRIFISHPFRSDPEGNMQKIRLIEKRLATLEIAYFSPLSNYQALKDEDAKQREFGLRCCAEWIPYNDELWLFDEWEKSEGCQAEHAVALQELRTIRVVKGWDANHRPIFERASPGWLKF
ncbi:MAG: DUF7768 domain-containing protein [Desulfitobacteriaceae bacterium]